MRILITRPLENTVSLVRSLAEKGHTALADPLISVKPLRVKLPFLPGFQGIITTSQYAVRCFARLTPERAIPLWCVGSVSARVAEKLGFFTVYRGGGSASALVSAIVERVAVTSLPFLHLSGDTIRVDVATLLKAQGIKGERHVIYETSEAENFKSQTLQALRMNEIDAILFYSPRTARIFYKLCRKADLESHCLPITAACLSPAIAEEISQLPWKSIRIAKKTTTDDLLMALMMAD